MAKNITKIKHRFPLKQLRLLPQFIARSWPIIGLSLFTSILAFLNYEPGTWLTGWDNLHPEFDFLLNLKRGLFAVWQEYQGLGLLGGMAHAADLPRTLFLYLLNVIGLPTPLIRYSWTFLMLLTGPLGVYAILDKRLLSTKFDDSTARTAAFFGALFYLSNLATIQVFFIPFETFTSFYGFLPWLIYFFLGYLTHPSFKAFLALFLISLLASPSFYVETIFIVLLLCLAPLLVTYVSGAKFSPKSIKNSILALLGLILPHLYWLLPVVFFVFTNGAVGTQAKINLLSSPETYDRNLKFANFTNLSLLKGYLFDFTDLTQGGQYDYLLKVWRDHLNNPAVSLIGYLLFALVLTGFTYAHKKRLPYVKGLTTFALVCLFFLLGGNLLVNNKIPLIGELFRSPFTKFSTPLAFIFSLFFAVGTIFILDLFSFLHSRLTHLLTSFTLLLFLIAFISPAFSGYLISPSMRQNLPTAYTELFHYFKDQPSGRIANFPQYTFWGWQYSDWGYRGSGLIWYGLPQAVLDRAFDVWNKPNENYYEQLNQALYSQNLTAIEDIVHRYNINWLVIDFAAITPDANVTTYTTELADLLASSKHFTHLKDFGNQIAVYKTDVAPSEFISLQQRPNRQPVFDLSYRPQTYTTENDQIKISTTLPTTGSLSFPSPTTAEKLLPVTISYRKNGGQVVFKLEPILPKITLNQNPITFNTSPNYLTFKSPGNTNNLILEINDLPYELQLPGELDSQTIFYPLATTYLPTNQSVTARLYNGAPDTEIDLTTILGQSTPYQCYTQKSNRQIEKIVSEDAISLLGTDVVGCLSTPLKPYIATNALQLLSINYRHSSSTFTPANVNITSSSLDATTLPQPQEPKSTPTFTRQFARGSSVPLQLNLILEANEIKSVQEINYQNITLASYSLLDTTSFNLNTISNLTTPITAKDQLTLTLPIADSLYTVHQTPSENSLSPTSQNCNQFGNGKTDKTVDSTGFIYSSQNAIGCDQLSLRHLPHTTSYAIIFENQHQSGLTPTVCLENHQTRRCDVFERLTDTTKPQVIIESIINPSETSGYTLHYFNQSFNYRPTVNLLKSLTITPIPLSFIQSINTQTTSPTSSPKTSLSTTHPAEFLYTATFKTDQKTNLNLYQTYSPHWLALEVNDSFSKLTLPEQIIKLPQLLKNTKILSQTHNSWHNSWDIEPGQFHLVIFYWPQYLEFAGLAIIPISLLIFLLLSLFNRKK